MAVSRQCKTRGNRTKTEPPSSGFPDSSEAAIILHHRLGPVSVRESDCSRLLLLGAAFTNPKQISAETTVLADEIEDLDTTTPDSADTGIARKPALIC